MAAVRGHVVRKILLVAAVTSGVLGVVTPASADKPARGCPDNFRPFTQAEIAVKFPNVTQGQFERIDKNRDSIICGKQTRGIFNPIDNTANRP